MPVVPEVEAEDGVAAHGTDAAVKVADGDAEEEAADVTEDRIAEVFVEWRHGSGFDFAAEAVAHDEIVALFEPGEEAGELAEVVTGVGVGHEDVFSVGGLDAGHEGRAVAADWNVDDAGAFVGGDFLRAVGAAVVGDDDLAGDVVVAKGGDGLLDAEGERLCFVKAGHKDGDQQLAHYLNATKVMLRGLMGWVNVQRMCNETNNDEMRGLSFDCVGSG